MSEGNNSEIDCESQSLLVVASDASPRHRLQQVIFLFYSSALFLSGARSTQGSGGSVSTDDYTSICSSPNSKHDQDDHSEVVDVYDGSPGTSEDCSDIHSAQYNSLQYIGNQHHSEITNIGETLQVLSSSIGPAASDNSLHGIELQPPPEISVVSDTDSIGAISEEPSVLRMTPSDRHYDKLQRSQTQKIIQIVKEKNLDSFRSFGGIQGVVDALSSDLENGLCDEEDIKHRKRRQVFQSQIPELRFIQLMIDACKKSTIYLLCVAAVLALCFELKEEGRENGWIDGVIIIMTIIVLVTFTSSRRYYYERKFLKKLRKEREMEVHVTRRGCPKHINISDLVYGDIVLLNSGDKIPCDGLSLGGNSLEVDTGLGSRTNDENPFLFYGARVTGGSGRMIAVYVEPNTELNEMMRKASAAGHKNSKLELQLDKLSQYINVIGLLITILIFVVQFLRFVLTKIDDGNSYNSDYKGERTALRTILKTFERIITEQNSTAKALTTLLSISLVGIMEGMPFVVSIALAIWNNKILSNKATCRDFLACVKMASVTCICTDKVGGLSKKAISDGLKAEVRTILVSADDVSSLRSIAADYGLYNPDESGIIKGAEFRNLSAAERTEKVHSIVIMGNCNPSDKQLLVKHLRERGQVVAMVEWQTSDVSALKESDIGVTLGTLNSVMARESSDIIILDGSLDFVFYMIDCGRCAYGKVQKFIQVQLIMTVSSSLINFIWMIFMGNAAMTTVQLFGLNLVMTFIDGMALLTGPVMGKQVNEITVRPTEPLITKAMSRNIIAQASYQIIILMTLQRKWQVIKIMPITEKTIQSMIFNSFILCQGFNLFNARELQEKNFFRGIHRNYWFLFTMIVYTLCHAVFVIVEHRLAKRTCFNWKIWVGCLFIGILSWLVDWIGKSVLPITKINWFTGRVIEWTEKCKSLFTEREWLPHGFRLYSESSPSRPIPNLHDPLIPSSETTTIPLQNPTLE